MPKSINDRNTNARLMMAAFPSGSSAIRVTVNKTFCRC
jgi:hypothetical protein